MNNPGKWNGINCWECGVNPSDHQPRAYKEAKTERVFAGTRNFCCDDCENNYQAKMDRENPLHVNAFERIL